MASSSNAISGAIGGATEHTSGRVFEGVLAFSNIGLAGKAFTGKRWDQHVVTMAASAAGALASNAFEELLAIAPREQEAVERAEMALHDLTDVERLYELLLEILPRLPERAAWEIAEFTHYWHEP